MLVHDWGMRCAQVIGAHAPLSCAWRTTHKRWNHHTCFLSLEPCAHDMNAEYFNLLGSGMNMSLNSWVWVLAKMWKSILVLNEYAQPQHSRVCACMADYPKIKAVFTRSFTRRGRGHECSVQLSGKRGVYMAFTRQVAGSRPFRYSCCFCTYAP